MGRKQQTAVDERVHHEKMLIGCAIMGQADVREACGWLSADAFTDELRANVWRRFAAGEDALNVAVDLGTQFYFEATGWANNDVASYFEADAHARALARLSHLDNAQQRAAALGQAITTGDYDAYRSLLGELTAQMPPGTRHIETAIDVGEAFILALASENRIIPTFISALDRGISGGLERQTLSVLAARPSMGKSSMALQIARNVATSRRKALFVSLEMAKVNLWARAACPEVELTWADVKGGRITERQLNELVSRSQDLMYKYGANLLIHDEACTTETIGEMAAAERPDLLIVDHLRLVADTHDNENKRLGLITWRLKQLAKTLDMHVMVLAQLNRNPDARTDNHRPVLSDLRDSGEIEENADLVIMPYRDGWYRPEPKACVRSRTELWVRKARDGQSNMAIRLMFDKRRQWFDDPEPSELWEIGEAQ